MSDSLFSASWYRVEKLRPRLRSHAQIHRHWYRDELWYVLQDHSSGRFNRYSPEAFLIIQLMNGRRTMGEIWDLACERLGDDMPSQDEIISLLGQLHANDVLQSDTMPDIADIHQRFVRNRRNKILQYIRSPLALRLPLIDPERFLEATQRLVMPMLSPAGFVVWFALVVVAVLQAGAHWDALTQNWSDRVFNLGNFVILWFVYPVVKLLHEFGHAYMVKRFGGEVHEMGLMFLVFVPVPYVDASAASALRSKYQRMLVGGAGILVELALASVALLLWVQMEPGLARAALYNVMLIGGVSTLLFNGNPLLRFDAYYVLSDFVEMPNFGTRSNAYLGYWLQRYVLMLEEAESPATTVRQALWLGLYAVASFVYRLSIMIGIAVYVATKFFIVGVLIALWSVSNILVMPTIKLVTNIRRNALLTRYRNRVINAALLGAAALGAILFIIPFPLMSTTEGVIWAPEEAQIHVMEDCSVLEVTVENGDRVDAGTSILTCESLELSTQVTRIEAKLDELNARARATLKEDLTQHEIIKDEIRRTSEELAIGRDRLAGLVLKAPVSGHVMLAKPADLVGRYLQKGQYLGYVDRGWNNKIRAVVAQEDVFKVQHDMLRVDVKLAESVAAAHEAVVHSATPAATRELPSMALSVNGGGKIVLDPAQRAPGRITALSHYFIVDLDLAGRFSDHVGERVYVRFHHTPEPLGYRLLRSARRLFLRRFEL